MQVNTLKLSTKRKKTKLIGRGGKKGTYSGKGMKGQKARSGGSVNPLFEGGRSSLIDRLKKIRGFKSLAAKPVVIKFSDVEKKFATGATINKESLILAGLLSKKEAKIRVKILGAGADIKQKFNFGTDVLVSLASKKAIEKAGGEVAAFAPKKRQAKK
jgi:large subunit ribosomal protein L15